MSYMTSNEDKWEFAASVVPEYVWDDDVCLKDDEHIAQLIKEMKVMKPEPPLGLLAKEAFEFFMHFESVRRWKVDPLLLVLRSRQLFEIISSQTPPFIAFILDLLLRDERPDVLEFNHGVNLDSSRDAIDTGLKFSVKNNAKLVDLWRNFTPNATEIMMWNSSYKMVTLVTEQPTETALGFEFKTSLAVEAVSSGEHYEFVIGKANPPVESSHRRYRQKCRQHQKHEHHQYHQYHDHHRNHNHQTSIYHQF